MISTSCHIVVNDVSYHVLDFTSGEVEQGEAPVVLLHGFAGSAEDFLFLGESQYAINKRCLAIDALGHGKSDIILNAKRYGMTYVMRDLDSILSTLQIPVIDLVGYSMGGRMALAYALFAPSRIAKLVLESASPGLRTREEREARSRQDAELAERIQRDGIEKFVLYWEKIPLFASQHQVPHERLLRQKKTRLSQSPDGLANSLLGVGTGSQMSYWDLIGNIKASTLLFTGQLDHKFTNIAQEISALMSSVSMIECPDVGHNVHLEKPELFSERLFSFLHDIR